MYTTALSGNDLRFWLGQFVKGNEYLIRTRRLPPLYESGVRYASEREDLSSPRPVEDFLFADELLVRRFGDCEDLACYRCAELRLRGIEAYPQVTSVGNNIYHVTVLIRQHGRQVREDPSKELGMKGTG